MVDPPEAVGQVDRRTVAAAQLEVQRRAPQRPVDPDEHVDGAVRRRPASRPRARRSRSATRSAAMVVGRASACSRRAPAPPSPSSRTRRQPSVDASRSPQTWSNRSRAYRRPGLDPQSVRSRSGCPAGDPLDELVDRSGADLGDERLGPLVDLVVGESVAPSVVPWPRSPRMRAPSISPSSSGTSSGTPASRGRSGVRSSMTSILPNRGGSCSASPTCVPAGEREYSTDGRHAPNPARGTDPDARRLHRRRRGRGLAHRPVARPRTRCSTGSTPPACAAGAGPGSRSLASGGR